MKQSTIHSLEIILDAIIASGVSAKVYFDTNNTEIAYSTFMARCKSAKEGGIRKPEDEERILSKINQINNQKQKTKQLDTENHIEAYQECDEDGKITCYRYKIYKKNKPALDGRLTREEMSKIMRMYTYEGGGFTAKVVSREFPQFSVQDLKRIFKAFAIYKDNCPFAPHDVIEKSIEELRDIQIREKENDFMRKAEEERIKNNEKLLKKYAQENFELKQKLNLFSDIKIEIPKVTPITWDEYVSCGQSINLYLADFHLGSYTTSGSLYDINNNYGFDEAKRRLTKVLVELGKFDCFDTVNIVLLGDMIDCAGVTGMTARMDHIMPNNMDAREQLNKFIELMDWFITSLVDSDRCLTSKINVYSVPNGNHGGNYEYAINKYLMSYLNVKFPQIYTELFDKFYGKFELEGHVFIPMHGKDSEYMKKPLPLNLDDKSKVMIYEWLMKEDITSEKVHFIKGDLHSNALSSCKRFDYRNVLSLYGSSDYCAYNYSANSYGVSYDLMIGDNLIRGTFENM